jgi:hypothetical protein
MAFITSYLLEINKQQIIDNLKIRNKEIEFSAVRDKSIGNFFISSQANGFVCGKIAVNRVYNDYEFNLSDEFEIQKSSKELYIYDEVYFTIFPDLKIISFASKEKAILFGMEILSWYLFNDRGKILHLTFDPQKVLEAKRQGIFENVWFNGVKFSGNIQYTGQFGTEIDEDADFLDNPEKRMGIGIVIRSASGKNIKIIVYKDGTLLRYTKLKDPRDEAQVEKEIIQAFLKFSDYGYVVPKDLSDQFTTLGDFI